MPLPRPVAPGASIVTRHRVHARSCPQVFARTGYERRLLPGRPVVSEDRRLRAGRACAGAKAGGWNCHQFHANSRVLRRLRPLPRRHHGRAAFVVGATGPRTGARDERGRHDDVHLRAGRRARLRVDGRSELRRGDARFSGDGDVTPPSTPRRAALLGRTLDEVRLSDVEIRLLMQPGRRPQIERYVRAAKLGHQVLRALVRALSVPHADGRGSRPGRRRLGRHGVPDASSPAGTLHAVQLLAVQRRPRARRW